MPSKKVYQQATGIVSSVRPWNSGKGAWLDIDLGEPVCKRFALFRPFVPYGGYRREPFDFMEYDRKRVSIAFEEQCWPDKNNPDNELGMQVKVIKNISIEAEVQVPLQPSQ